MFFLRAVLYQQSFFLNFNDGNQFCVLTNFSVFFRFIIMSKKGG